MIWCVTVSVWLLFDATMDTPKQSVLLTGNLVQVGCSMTGSKSYPPIEAEQPNLGGFLFLPGLRFQSVHIVVVGRKRLNIYFYHAPGGQRNVSVISVTALTSIPRFFGASGSPYRHCLMGSS